MNTIQEILDRNPREYSTQDIDTIIADLRQRRHQFNLGNLKAGSTKPLTTKQKDIISLNDALKSTGIDL